MRASKIREPHINGTHSHKYLLLKINLINIRSATIVCTSNVEVQEGLKRSTQKIIISFVESRSIDKWHQWNILSLVKIFMWRKRLKQQTLMGIGTSSEIHLVQLCLMKINVFTHNIIGRKDHPFICSVLLLLLHAEASFFDRPRKQ